MQKCSRNGKTPLILPKKDEKEKKKNKQISHCYGLEIYRSAAPYCRTVRLTWLTKNLWKYKYLNYAYTSDSSCLMKMFVIWFQGVVIREVVNGTECDTCKDRCPGFEPHQWR